MIMRFEREQLLKGIELLRENGQMNAEEILDLICIKNEVVLEKGRSRVPNSRNYTEGEKELFRSIIKTHKEVHRVPQKLVEATAEQTGRSLNAIVSQLYLAVTELGGSKNE